LEKKQKKNIGIIGYGWLGSRMGEKWRAKNELYTTTTSAGKLSSLQEQGLNPTLVDFNVSPADSENSLWEAVSGLDVLIVTAPVSTRRDKVEQHIRNRIRHLAAFIGPFTGQMFFMDSTSVYPDAQQEFYEDDLPVEEVLSEKLLKALYPQINILRLGGLMGDDRQLSKYNVSNLDAPVNHVHFQDVISIIEKMMEKGLAGKLYNIVAPEHPSKSKVIDAQKKSSTANVQQTGGRIISSEKLQKELGYTFHYPDPKYFHLSP